MQKQQLLYKGKAKSVYETEDNDLLILHFRDDTSALDGKRIEQLARKGEVNNRFNSFIMQKLSEAGIETHFEQQLSSDEVLVKRMDMLPVECVVRNYAAGSLVRRLGLEEGQELTPPTFELFYKDDALGDPMVNESLAITLNWATEDHQHHLPTQDIAILLYTRKYAIHNQVNQHRLCIYQPGLA